MKKILKYSKYSWVIWLVIKAMVTLELGICEWIFSCGCVFSIFINCGLFSVVRLGFFQYELTEHFLDIFFYEQSLQTCYLHQKPIQETVVFLKDMAIVDDVGILIVFMVITGDFAWVYREYLIRGIYRDVRRGLAKQFYKNDFLNINIFKWRKFNSDEEYEIYMDVRAVVIELVSFTNISTYSLALEDTKTKRSIYKIIKEELLKIKYEAKKQVTDQSKKKSQAAENCITNTRNSVHNCWTCQYPSRYLMKCSGCKKARYCGETCYVEDWKRHRDWCRKKGEKKKCRNKALIWGEGLDDEVD